MTHADILTPAESCEYLRLAAVSERPESALRVLERLRAQGKIHPLKWCATYLYHRADLDAFVAAELAALHSKPHRPSARVGFSEGGRGKSSAEVDHDVDREGGE